MSLFWYRSDQPLHAQILVAAPRPQSAARRRRLAGTVRRQRQRLEVVGHVRSSAARGPGRTHRDFRFRAGRLPLRLLELEAEVAQRIQRLGPAGQRRGAQVTPRKHDKYLCYIAVV